MTEITDLTIDQMEILIQMAKESPTPRLEAISLDDIVNWNGDNTICPLLFLLDMVHLERAGYGIVVVPEFPFDFPLKVDLKDETTDFNFVQYWDSLSIDAERRILSSVFFVCNMVTLPPLEKLLQIQEEAIEAL